jgi:hypothetical protein
MRTVILSSLLMVLAPATARADSGFRCNSGRLVTVEDRMYEVLDRCGNPDLVGHRVAARQVGDDYVEVVLDEWIYDLGPARFVRTVIFENGRVIDVESGNYGRKGR